MRFSAVLALASLLLYGQARSKEPDAVKWISKQGWIRDSIVDTRGKLSRVYTRITAEGKQQWLVCPLASNCASENTDDCVVLPRCKVTSSELKATDDPGTKFIDVAPTEERALLSKYSTLDNQEELDRLRSRVVSTCQVDNIFAVLLPDKFQVQVDGIINAAIFLDDTGKTYSCMLNDNDQCQSLVSEKRSLRECVLTKWCVRYIKEGEVKDCK